MTLARAARSATGLPPPRRRALPWSYGPPVAPAASATSVVPIPARSFSAAAAPPKPKPKKGPGLPKPQRFDSLRVIGGGRGSWRFPYNIRNWSNGPSWKDDCTRTPLLATSAHWLEVPSPNSSGFRDCSFGLTHGAFVSGEGHLYTWGSGRSGQLGQAGIQWAPEPALVNLKHLHSPVAAVSCGDDFTALLLEDGRMYVIGRVGEHDKASSLERQLPYAKSVDAELCTHRFHAISAGSDHLLALGDNGYVFACGDNKFGQLGNNTRKHSPTALQLCQNIWEVTHVAAGRCMSFAVVDEQPPYNPLHPERFELVGGLYSWGNNAKSATGHSDEMVLKVFAGVARLLTPECVGLDLVYAAAGRGEGSGVGIRRNGTLLAWGRGARPVYGSEPRVPYEDVAMGSGFGAAVDQRGHVVTWTADPATLTLGRVPRSDERPREWGRVEGWGPRLHLRMPQPELGVTTRDETVSDEGKEYYGRAGRVVTSHNRLGVLAFDE